jgi:hypothetical protein
VEFDFSVRKRKLNSFQFKKVLTNILRVSVTWTDTPAS